MDIKGVQNPSNLELQNEWSKLIVKTIVLGGQKGVQNRGKNAGWPDVVLYGKQTNGSNFWLQLWAPTFGSNFGLQFWSMFLVNILAYFEPHFGVPFCV